MSSFESLGIRAEILRALADLGFEKPTPVQERTIPLLLTQGGDMVALAHTGTGKTAAFGIPLLERISPQAPAVQALVLAPTRELCVQISNDIRQFAAHLEGVKVVPVYGGASIREQIRGIKYGANVVVATPGRLIDLLERRAISLEDVQTVVLDEADEMLNMGFQEDIDLILGQTPADKSTWLFSATMGPEVRRIAKQYMHQAQEVSVGGGNKAGEGITHQYTVVVPRDRYLALKRFVDTDPAMFAIVFCRTKQDTQELAESLVRDGYHADAIHGDLSQQQRDRVMARYRNRSLQLLIATDVAARGIDVSDVSHVIHFDLPGEIESYTHRSGRTGRAGKTGISLSIIGMRDLHKVRTLEQKLKVHFAYVKVPDGSEILERQLLAFVGKIKEAPVDEEAIAPLAEAVRLDLEGIDREELIRRVIALEFNRSLKHYKEARDLNVDLAVKDRRTKARGQHAERGQEHGGMEHAPTGPMRSMFINLGTKDGFDKGKMLGYLCGITGLDGQHFGRILLKDSYSFVDIAGGSFDEAIAQFRAANYKGRKVRVDEGGGATGARAFKQVKKQFNKTRYQ
ncbi:MAG TPA: DEAD/DEAH box helicase [Flavobacteriales bacterium]|nr:DEAD/DEAH box helicase [Flavobacteriales bacterium]